MSLHKGSSLPRTNGVMPGRKVLVGTEQLPMLNANVPFVNSIYEVLRSLPKVVVVTHPGIL